MIFEKFILCFKYQNLKKKRKEKVKKLRKFTLLINVTCKII